MLPTDFETYFDYWLPFRKNTPGITSGMLLLFVVGHNRKTYRKEISMLPRVVVCPLKVGKVLDRCFASLLINIQEGCLRFKLIN